ncbi:MAG: efflux RND transporter periplasmic adaptor subunit [Succinivibrio sp.]
MKPKALILTAAVAAALLGCGGQKNGTQSLVQEVGVITVKTEPVTISREFTGRVVSKEEAEIRPQITGIVKARLFHEGDQVQKDQVLYQIDDASYKAAYDQAAAKLQNAEAAMKTASLKASRYNTLLKTNAVARQDADDAQAAYEQDVAAVAECKAAVEKAKIDLDRTQIRSPISGRAGISKVTPGALVTENQSQALVTVRLLDPINVDITQSSAQMLSMKQRFRNKIKSGAVIPVRLILENNSEYGLEGRITSAEVAVDESTGTMTIRAEFPNPNHDLLPGMYVRAIVYAKDVIPDGIMVPQQGVTRDSSGKAVAFVVTPENKVEMREITAEEAIGDKWLVASGLKAGDRVMVEGTSKVRAGAAVKPVDVTAKYAGEDQDKASGGTGESSSKQDSKAQEPSAAAGTDAKGTEAQQ